MLLKDRIEALVSLGKKLRKKDDRLTAVIQRSYNGNRWFTADNAHFAIQAICDNYLEEEDLLNWILKYKIKEQDYPKRVGFILNGSVPLDGFHDIICAFIQGHISHVRLSDKDAILIPFFVELMIETYPDVEAYFEFPEQLKSIEVAIVDLSHHSNGEHLKTYFSKYPNIFKVQRNAVAILSGEEGEEDLRLLGIDVLQFFGLSPWSVSKIYVPEGYKFDRLLEALHEYREIINHNKYKNNFDYNYTLYILNKIKHHSTGCILLIEQEIVQSRIASLHFEYYKDDDHLKELLESKKEKTQCVVGDTSKFSYADFDFGKVHQRGLNDYSSEIDTMNFLMELNKQDRTS